MVVLGRMGSNRPLTSCWRELCIFIVLASKIIFVQYFTGTSKQFFFIIEYKLLEFLSGESFGDKVFLLPEVNLTRSPLLIILLVIVS